MKKILIVLLTLAFSTAMFAQKVSEEQALQKAQQFFKDKGIVSANPRRAKKIEQQSDATQEDFYVFNAENKGGFVIISGDERTPEVLGYADSGSIDMDTLPPNIKWWLSEYTKQIKAIDSLGITKRSASKRAPKAAIATLMTTKWGQDDPYNMKCPIFFNEGRKCVTGCVATAMAQVMYYHRAMSTLKITATIPSYVGNSFWQNLGQLTIDEIPEGSIIDWDNMLDKYNGSETTIQKEAVANLMLYCGASVKMDYDRSGSGAYDFDVPVAMKQYFDYSENTTLVWRQNYSEEEWDELIYSELTKGNPVYYSGQNSSVGHAFVCDGFDGNGYYHINWGWNGLSDSFFLLSALTPNQQGIGGSSEGYNDGQCALIGAVPNGKIMRLTSQSVSLTGNTSFTLAEVGANITVPVKWNVKNQVGTSCSFDHAIGLYHNGELVKVLEKTGTSETFTANQEKTIDASLVIETNLSSGIYQLYALSRSQSEEKWFRNEKSSDYYITLVVKGGSMTFFVGKPAAAENVINFADGEVKRICVENWDTDGDGEISYEEAAAVTDFGYVFDRSNIKTFDEAQYFSGITSFGLTSIYGYGCSNLVSIKLPSSVISIRDGAFYACIALKSIDIPASVKDIGKKAFQACFSLQEIGLHEGLENINDEAFYKCFALSSIHIPSSVTLIGDNLCFECINLNDFYVDANNPYYCAIDGVLFTKGRKTLKCFPVKREGLYNIPEGTEIINSNAFATSRLESVIIPMSVTKIEDFAFFSMQNLHDITIPSTVTSIGKRALGFCTNLKKVIWEGGRVIIPEGMFSQCLRLDNMELPDNIESIGSYAFGSCYELAEITIPSKVTSIGDYAFAGSGLRKVRSLMQVPCTITSTVFENINSNAILYVPEESIDAYKATDNWKNFSQILPIGESAVELYAELNSGVLTFYHDAKRKERTGTTYELNDKALEVHDRYSWLNSTNSIMKVVFDSSFGNVRLSTTNSMFSDCNKLTEIQGIENLNTSEVTDMLGMFQHCNSLTNIDLSKFNTSKVTNMAGMFWGCSNLKTIILPDDLTFIDTHQFVDCSSLTDISIPSSVTFIGDHAFQYCYSLKEITIPADVTSIGDNAFSCTGLKKVKSLMQAPCRINSNVFENVSNNATLYVPAGCKAAYEAADYWKDFKKIMGPSSNLIYMVDGEEYRSYEIEHGSAITPEPAPTKEGYTFSGWSEIPEKMPAHDVTVTGTFTINKYKLTYKVDGAEYKSYDVEYGATITPEPAPTKEGYNFSGWSEIPEKMPAHDVTVTGTFTIVDPVTITAKSYSRKYGEENPNFEYTSEGATLTGIPEITCEATVTSPVGEYAIVISKGTVTNYNDHYVNGVLTITKAPLTIKAKNYSIKQGDALPTFEAEYSGFKNNETASVLSAQPTITTSATSASEPGTYEIIVSGASATNYEISYVKGTLTISAVEVEPVTETETTTFSETVNENTDLSNTIIDNTYFTMNAENGDGYDATEQAIVLNSTTSAEQMNTVQNAKIGDATMQSNYNGIVFEVPAGNGTITVEAKTLGSHVLNVQIGNGEPTKITKSERGTVDVPYNVTVPTYVYLYASTSGSSSAPKRAAAANSLLLYSYKVAVTVNGISVVTYDDLENAKWYTTDGLQLQGKPTKKGLYIVNGRKVVVK